MPRKIFDKTGRDGGNARMMTSVSSKGGVAAQPSRAPDQMQVFEAAMRRFHARDFAPARELFAQAAAGPDRGVASRAQSHVAMCDRRLAQPAVVLTTAEEHYDYAVTQINVRNLAAAQKHLSAALELDAKADHVYYALALCRALSGDLEGAYNHLQHAIELQPRNRVAARQDADFAAFVNQPPLDRLLFGDRRRGAS